ncbi:MAG: CRISPR-associated protein, Csd1 family [Candidatus Jettenia ecosi]|uniref:CRISPR-associated protein, Csd1 family n=1 Tax=Candidatus Jettenia ecosi TaxID=2494326 RepID=A0A533QNM3_9BACT|nr:MAG: CRISPR-associated protein, Csd1 family [Candidatus Jettenia ecosi]
MSWIEKLYRTYENCMVHIGDNNDEVPLLPVCHTTQKAHVTIVIDGKSNFCRAYIVPKSESRTIIPATEESAGRTSGTTPHPLCDKLQYVASDYLRFGGDKEACHEMYFVLLEKWFNTDKNHLKLKAIYEYVKKGHVIDDLVKAGILYVTLSDGKSILMNQWRDKDNIPEIFKLLPGGIDNKGKSRPWQADAFIRWSVEISGDPQADVWSDKSLWESWQSYYGNFNPVKGLCYVTGMENTLADQHPAKIRNDGDKAKLISSNDLTGFTFRGRFVSSDEACGVGFEVTQKAHSALRWLIARQGRRDGDQAIVVWAVSGSEVPDLLADTYFLVFGGDQELASEVTGYTAQEVGVAFSKLIAGYSAKLGSTEDIVVMGLDSATPGRMAITFYRELTGSELLKRVQAWHEGCAWLQRFGKGKIFVGAPSPRDIAEAAYGRRLDEKLRKATIERLLPCIVDGASIQRDIVESCVRRASNRNGIESWEWEKALGIACALFRKLHEKEGYSMALDESRKTRDYLYGRLLALADSLEQWALSKAGEDRPTNAARLMYRFADHPYSTWRTIELSLAPYKARLGGQSQKRQALIDKVHSLFDPPEDYTSDKKLSGEFLLGYHCQRAALWKGKPDPNDANTDRDAEGDEEEI